MAEPVFERKYRFLKLRVSFVFLLFVVKIFLRRVFFRFSRSTAERELLIKKL